MSRRKWDDLAYDFGETEGKPRQRKKRGKKRGRRGRRKKGEPYHRTYYQDNQETLSDKARERWEHNRGGYRDRGLERARNKRAAKRADTAARVHQERLAQVNGALWRCSKCGGEERVELLGKPWARGPYQCSYRKGCTGEVSLVPEASPPAVKWPMKVRLDGEALWVYTSGVLALRCGRSPATIRTWVEGRVIPGCAIRIGPRYWFTRAIIDAVAEAVRKVLFLDARTPHHILKRYVRQELQEQGVSYTPFPT